MSVASGFRDKWQTILAAADKTRGKSADERFAAMAKAADEADLVLLPRAMVAIRRAPMVHPETCPCTDCT